MGDFFMCVAQYVIIMNYRNFNGCFAIYCSEDKNGPCHACCKCR